MKYRILDVDDIIQSTDEVDACRDGWRDEPKWRLVSESCPHMIGRYPSDPHFPAHTIYRRLIEKK